MTLREKPPSGIIPTGPLAGLPKRPKVDRHRFLTPRQILELLNVEAYAEHRGLGFAAHLTLHWQCDPDFNPAAWSDRLGRFLDKLHRWLERNGIVPAFAWVNEHGREYGEHLHLLLHIPKPKRNAEQSFRAITAELAAWIIDTENLATDKMDRFGKPWPPVKITGGSFGMRNRKMRSGVCRYLLKGIDPKDVAYTGFGAEPRAAFLGIKPKRNAKPISVQRSGASRNLKPKARRGDPSWSDLRSLVELHARLNPT